MKMRSSIFLLSVLVVYTLPDQVLAQIDWDLYTGNPVYTGDADPEPFEIYHPRVLVGDPYRMWYTRKITDGDYENIGYATSADGLSWTLVDPAVMNPSTDPNRFDSDKLGQGCVLWDAGIFKMWYWGDGPNIGNIGYATSSDGITWTRVDGAGMDQSVYDRDMDGADALALTTPCVVRIDDSYHMWYSRVVNEGGMLYRIAYATSPDGLAWTNVPGPEAGGAVLDAGEAGSFDEGMVFYPLVVVNGDEFQMWYGGWDSAYVVRSGYATSSDGITWTRVTGNGTNGACLDEGGSGTVVRSGDYYRYWFSSGTTEFSLATSGELEGVRGDNRWILPGRVELTQNYPNPFNPATNISYTLSEPLTVHLAVYDLRGRLLATLVDESQPSGLHTTSFEAGGLVSGVYYYQLIAGDQRLTRKMLLVR